MNHFRFLLLSCFLFLNSCAKELEEKTNELPSQEELTQLMNLLTNGNCEKWAYFKMNTSADYLSGWAMKENNGTVFRESNVICEGRYSAKLCSPQKGVTAFISQTIKVAPGHRIRICHNYLMEQLSGNGAKMYCYFRESRSSNIPNNTLTTFYDDSTLNIIRGGGYGIAKFSDTNGKWENFDYIIRVPAIANYFVFEIHSYAGTVFYVDDCYVVDIDM